jgi:hypothetical protein
MIYYYRHQKANFFASAEAISHHFQHFFSLSRYQSLLVLVVDLGSVVGCCLINSFDFQLIFIPSSRFPIRQVSENGEKKKREKLAIFNLSRERLQSVEQRSSGAITSRCLGFFLLLLLGLLVRASTTAKSHNFIISRDAVDGCSASSSDFDLQIEFLD